MSDASDRFDQQVFRCPIEGWNLVEASAGTGKTYQIQNLYARIILEKGWTVDQILVVTFTDAATEELRERLQAILTDVVDALGATEPPGARVADLLTAATKALIADGIAPARAEALCRYRAEQASLDFDQAAIFTIHGFCARMLGECAFECGIDFDSELVGDRGPLLDEVVGDVFRELILPLPAAITALTGPLPLQHFAQHVREALSKPAVTLVPALPAAPLAIPEWLGKRLGAADESLTKDVCKLWLSRAFVERARARLETLKHSRNVITYDDQLLQLRQALTDDAEDEAGALLKQAIVDRYQIAVVDEFQDTDPVQCEIFVRAFRRQDLPVFVVGDPKQAIYGFRSGDLETYFQTRKNETTAQYSLHKNWRSESNMVAAVNGLFREDPADADDSGRIHRAFATDKIWMTPAAAAVSESGAPKPLTIEFLDDDLNKDQGREAAAELTARRIDELLRTRGVEARQVAVLVRTHREARQIKSALQTLAIPAVLQSSGKIFDSDEAGDVRYLLAAMLTPGDLNAVRTALATPLTSFSGDQLYADQVGALPPEVQHAAEAFLRAHQDWTQRSFFVGFERLLRELEVDRRLLALDNGERRLTNLHHLGELLDRVARDRKLGPRAILHWYDRQLNPDTRANDDEYEIRLESDDDAVRVMTVFKSKGLQFPYVFAPFQWTGDATVGKVAALSYHDDGELIMDFDVKSLLADVDAVDPEAPRNRHQDEKLGEQLRLLYVAVTRAEKETHLIAGDVGRDQRQGLHYLLSRAAAPVAGEPLVESLPKTYAFDDLNHDHGPHVRLVRAGEETLYPDGGRDSVEPNGGRDSVEPNGGRDSVEPLAEARTFTGVVDRNWQILSFSSLTDHGAPGQKLSSEQLRDYDAEAVRDQQLAQREKERYASHPDSLFCFTAGAVTGNCWHAIFEHLDFTDRDAIRPLVIKHATHYGLLREASPDTPAAAMRERRIKTLERMVNATLDLQLPDCHRRLGEVALDNRLAEMQFNFPVPAGGVSRATIARALLASNWSRLDDFRGVLEDWLAEPETPALQGFMTGFVDLLFRADADGRYYLLDWKSNRLDGTYDAFTPDGLTREMARNRYFLQYLLYSVALHQHLAATVPDYDFDRHFGGAYYVFLRGILPPPGSELWDAAGCAVYADRPDLATLQRLGAVLGQFRGGS